MERLKMEPAQDKGRRVEIRCTYCHKYLGEYFYQHAADNYSDEGGCISHGICLSCLIEYYPNEYPAIKKAFSKRSICSQHPADGNPKNLEITRNNHIH